MGTVAHTQTPVTCTPSSHASSSRSCATLCSLLPLFPCRAHGYDSSSQTTHPLCCCLVSSPLIAQPHPVPTGSASLLLPFHLPPSCVLNVHQINLDNVKYESALQYHLHQRYKEQESQVLKRNWNERAHMICF